MKASNTVAQGYCSSFGLELATFESKEESEWFSNLYVASLQNFQPNWVYIGGIRFFNDPTQNKNELMKHWYWEKSGRKINFDINWDQGQPNNHNNIQWCLAINKMNRTVYYADVECFNRDEYFICQKYTVFNRDQ